MPVLEAVHAYSSSFRNGKDQGDECCEKAVDRRTEKAVFTFLQGRWEDFKVRITVTPGTTLGKIIYT